MANKIDDRNKTVRPRNYNWELDTILRDIETEKY